MKNQHFIILSFPDDQDNISRNVIMLRHSYT